MAKFTAPASTVLLFESQSATPAHPVDVVVTDPLEGSKGLTTNPIGGWMSPSGQGGNCGGSYSGAWGGAYTLAYATGNLGASQPTSMPRHTQGSNFLAADGHVKYLLPTLVSVGQTGGTNGGQYTPPADSGCWAATTSVMYLDHATLLHPVTLTFSYF